VTGISQQSASYNANDQVTANTYDSNGNTLGRAARVTPTIRWTDDSFNNGSVRWFTMATGTRGETVGGVTTHIWWTN